MLLNYTEHQMPDLQQWVKASPIKNKKLTLLKLLILFHIPCLLGTDPLAFKIPELQFPLIALQQEKSIRWDEKLQ